MLLSHCNYPQCQCICTLCHDNRRSVGCLAVIFKSNRIVSRVTDNHICGRHFLHHTLLCHFLLFTLYLALYLRVTFELFVLVLDLLL